MEKSINSVFYCKKCNQSYPIKSKNYHDSFCNSNTKFCPYCHLEINSIEYNDHIFCHKLDNENNNFSFHLNNNNVRNNNKDLEIQRINSKIVKVGNTEFYDCEDELKEIKRLEEEKKIYNEKMLVLKEKKQNTTTKIKNFFSNNGTDIAIVTFSLIGCVFLIPECYYILAGKIMEAFQNNPDEKGKKNEKMNPEEIMKYLPITKLGKKKIINKDIEFKCIICYEDFNEGDNITTLPCAHVFHIGCIKTWIYEHGNCPVCKFDITKKSLLGEL